jgi:hypothetical protein
MAVALLLLVVLALVVLGATAYSSSQAGVRAAEAEARVRAAQAEVRRLQALVEDIREVAWSHRELDSALATIIIDTIRNSQREDRGELP